MLRLDPNFIEAVLDFTLTADPILDLSSDLVLTADPARDWISMKEWPVFVRMLPDIKLVSLFTL